MKLVLAGSRYFGASVPRYAPWNWAVHHGYVTWQLAEHALVTGDENWYREVLPHQLLLQVERVRGDDDAVVVAQRVQQRRHEVRERLPGARPRLSQQVP